MGEGTAWVEAPAFMPGRTSTTIQKRLLHHQVEAFLDRCSTCPDCGAPLKAKGSHTRSFHTLFGTFKLASPRLFHCRCRRRKTTSFRPLSALLTESAAPELLFMETKWSSLVSYCLTVDALTDGRGLAAALMLGAEGVVMGTRFAVAG
jgi:hypothetical protein